MDLQNILNQTMPIIINVHDSKLGVENKTWKAILMASSPALRQASVVSVVSEVYKYQWTSKDWPRSALTLPAVPVKQRSAICGRGTKQIRHQLLSY